mmetsp:Transcript_98697/g.307505  ORF Transcript_98697/g.307505 Transcript_98697/m.307505 type:complete len:322 (+) Transcript_98697:173-1138(+)
MTREGNAVRAVFETRVAHGVLLGSYAFHNRVLGEELGRVTAQRAVARAHVRSPDERPVGDVLAKAGLLLPGALPSGPRPHHPTAGRGVHVVASVAEEVVGRGLDHGGEADEVRGARLGQHVGHAPAVAAIFPQGDALALLVWPVAAHEQHVVVVRKSLVGKCALDPRDEVRREDRVVLQDHDVAVPHLHGPVPRGGVLHGQRELADLQPAGVEVPLEGNFLEHLVAGPHAPQVGVLGHLPVPAGEEVGPEALGVEPGLHVLAAVLVPPVVHDVDAVHAQVLEDGVGAGAIRFHRRALQTLHLAGADGGGGAEEEGPNQDRR